MYRKRTGASVTFPVSHKEFRKVNRLPGTAYPLHVLPNRLPIPLGQFFLGSGLRQNGIRSALKASSWGRGITLTKTPPSGQSNALLTSKGTVS